MIQSAKADFVIGRPLDMPRNLFHGQTGQTLINERRPGLKTKSPLLPRNIELGADVNQTSAGDQNTSLVTAICNDHYDVTKFLLEHGADPNQPSVDGLAALYAVMDTQWALAGAAYRGDNELVNLLVSKGVKLDTRNTRAARPRKSASVALI